jgi:hypothetical protein
MRALLCILGIFFTVVYIPIYLILKMVGNDGTLTEQYTWVTTAAFLHGYSPAVVIAIFLCLGTTIFTLIIQWVIVYPTSQNKPEPTRWGKLASLHWANMAQKINTKAMPAAPVAVLDALKL